MDVDSRARKIVQDMKGQWRGSYGMVCCPAHNDRTPSLQVTPGRSAVLFKCWAGCSQEAVLAALNSQKINRYTSGEPGDRAPEPSRRKLALQLWDSAVPIAGTSAERHLRSRAIDPTGLKVRFAPRCIVGPPDDREEHAALLIPFETDEGIIAVQRILIDPVTGEKRYHAGLREAKLTLGLVRNAAMRIGGQPTGDTLRLAEGFEEAVSVTQLSQGRLKVWGAGGIRRYGLIAIPERIRKIVIYSQHGPEAAEAIEAAREHLTDTDRELKIILPPAPAPMDWNDILKERAKC
ncbi:hypothetical protein GCM10023208_34850 [Erythrobacter westpacificensis]|uniref:Toprim domain-containing protein n=2 Tax=Erythrobacter westpacificensis TaxID=1055231 RepID=A0ABP9KU00_9SPHN